MKANDVFQSKYLKATDLKGFEPTVAIARVVMEELSGGDIVPVMYFQGKQKGMIVNRTNWFEIAKRYGDESDAWPGKEIVLYSTMVTNKQGATMEGLRVRVPLLNGKPSAPKAKPPNTTDDDDQVPDFDER